LASSFRSAHLRERSRLLGDVLSGEYEREDEQSDAIILSRKGHLQAASTIGAILSGLAGSGMRFAVQRKDIHCSAHVHSPGLGYLGMSFPAIILSRKGYPQAASHRWYANRLGWLGHVLRCSKAKGTLTLPQERRCCAHDHSRPRRGRFSIAETIMLSQALKKGRCPLFCQFVNCSYSVASRVVCKISKASILPHAVDDPEDAIGYPVNGSGVCE